ncbi:Anaerobic dimethyl sulfoxide reductase chain B, iron-sulfur binding subunit [hydrothermal vent metagenome]|uniref:Anaerobic dimethyl sulfoxide reductase chain B, iron-sulfur binding subunit n=1 Tax=hydrothermal vent metagenome TaxID=652676 RepID=A0A3B1C4G8_9ZZZZ
MKQLALVIDLYKCVGCHACAVNCKSWNNAGEFGPLKDDEPYGREPSGVWFNRVQTYEVGCFPDVQVINFPKSCMHCVDAPCVPVCPTNASYKRKEDGIVLVNYDDCIGCKYCSWACPYGCREFDEHDGVMKKCTLCVDRIYNENLPEEERQPACVLSCPTRARVFGDVNDPGSEASKAIREGMGYKLMPDSGANPSNHYLPHRITHVKVDEDEITVKKQDVLKAIRKRIDIEETVIEDFGIGG